MASGLLLNILEPKAFLRRRVAIAHWFHCLSRTTEASALQRRSRDSLVDEILVWDVASDLGL